jgi:DNA helicase-4
LFCVGDDWQAIYRFAGNDVDLMTRFPEHFGPTRRTDLRQTHRFNDKLLRASSSFVTANPQQLRKDLVAARQSDVPAVRVVSAVLAKDRIKQIEETLAEIWREAGGEPITVLLLGRYHFVLDAYRVVKPPDPKMGLELASVHQAKGREADYVVVLDVVNGRYGFPTEITDDPLLDLVLAGRSPFPHAEERRLFYVALTRARARTYLLTDDVDRSVFVDEMEAAPYAGLVIPSGARARTVACPTCRGGTLVRREGEFGVFWGCSNFPHCITKARTCPWCGVGAFVPRSFEYRCANNECGMVAQTCPKCGIGAVVPRTGRYGEFRGCTEWRSKGPSCTYTRS